LAEPALLLPAVALVTPDEIAHPGLKQLLQGLYALYGEGLAPTLDNLRGRLDNAPLLAAALRMQDVGRLNPDRAGWLGQILEVFRQRRALPAKQELKNQLQAAGDHAAALELLRRLQGKDKDAG